MMRLTCKLILDFCTDSFIHNNIDEAPDVPQFVTIKVGQQHRGAGAAGNEVNAGLGFLFGAHRSNPTRIVHTVYSEHHQTLETSFFSFLKRWTGFSRGGITCTIMLQTQNVDLAELAYLLVMGLSSVRPTPSMVKLQPCSSSGKVFNTVSSAVVIWLTVMSPTSCGQVFRHTGFTVLEND